MLGLVLHLPARSPLRSHALTHAPCPTRGRARTKPDSARTSGVGIFPVPIAIPGVRLTHPEPSNKLKTFHFEPNLWQTAFMSSFLTEA
jgi:hypothetical protein